MECKAQVFGADLTGYRSAFGITFDYGTTLDVVPLNAH
jgi:hypothetical protein